VSGIYDEPWAYELACSFRDVPGEVDVLLGWYVEHYGGLPGSILELAAGPAEHAREFDRRGIKAAALDLNPAMCAYAASKGPGLEVVQADMTDFDLGRPFDLVITMLDSTAHLMTLDAFVAHLDRAAAHLGPCGLYILEQSHPADRLTDAKRSTSSWTVEGGSVVWGEPDDVMDPITQIVEDHVTITATRDGVTRVVSGVVPYRLWTATEVLAAVRLSGRLQIVAQYGDFDQVSITDPDAWRMITIFSPA
jgi:SAM-dependent methyltransferase